MNHTFIYRSDEQNTRIISSLNSDLKFIRIQTGLTEIRQEEKKNVYTVIKKEDIKVLIIIEKKIVFFLHNRKNLI